VRYGSPQSDAQRLAVVVERLDEIDGDDPVRVADGDPSLPRVRRQQIERQAALALVERVDRQPELGELDEQPALHFGRVGELLQRDRVGRVRTLRVSRHDEHRAEPASSATSQLHRQSRFEHGSHVRPSSSTPVGDIATIVRVGGWKPTASPHVAQFSDSRTVTPPHPGQRSIRTAAS
jgi:hypothetical protein